MADSEYLIKIKTIADAQGLNLTTDQLTKLTSAVDQARAATKKHGEEGKETGGILDQLGSRSGQAREAIEGLEMASRAGASGIFGMAKAVRSLIEGLALNPFTFLAGAAIAFSPILIGIGREMLGFKKETEDAGKAAEEAKKHIEDMGKAGEAAAKVRFDSVTSSVNDLKAAAVDAEEHLKLILAAEARVDKARQNLELLENQQATGISEEQRARNEGRINSKYASRTAAREQTGFLGALQTAAAVEDAASSAASSASKQVETERSIVEKYQAQLAARQQLEKDLQEQNEIIANLRTGNGGEGRMATPGLNDAIIRKRGLQDQLGSGLQGPELTDTIARAEGALKAATENLAKAREEEAKATHERQRAQDTAEIQSKAALEAYKIESQTGGLTTSAAAAKARGADNNVVLQDLRARAEAAARAAREGYKADVYKPDYFDAADDRKRKSAEVDQRNADRQAAIKQATTDVEKAAGKLGDGKDEAADAKTLTDAINRLITIAGTNNNQLRALGRDAADIARRVSNLESQAANGTVP